MEATIGVEPTIESGGPTSKASPLKVNPSTNTSRLFSSYDPKTLAVYLHTVCSDDGRILSESRKVQYGDGGHIPGAFGVVHQDAVLLSDLAYNNINYSRSSATEEQVKLATDLRQHRRGFPALLDVEPGERGPKIVWRRQAVCVDPTYHLDEILQCPLDGPTSALARLEQRWRG
ncbi:MAG: hypothetical protein J3Q66DRAFT_393738 [Benniella sp.]|nr:MAG: hypothetical protein J3Q66DRAFT_393738 [Benniella sp.]